MGTLSPPLSQPASVPSAGSLWEPNITVEVLEAHQLRAGFTLGNESTHYQVLLRSFPHTENRSCFEHSQQIPAVTATSYLLVISSNPPPQVSFLLILAEPGPTLRAQHH